jgi:hypothetical protein
MLFPYPAEVSVGAHGVEVLEVLEVILETVRFNDFSIMSMYIYRFGASPS